MKFNEKLIELRKSKGWSQEELGEKLNVTRQTLSKWELGQTTPEMDKLIELSKLFDISIDTLVGNEVNTISTGTIPFRYEYKSKSKLFGLPLVHINTGAGPYKAKGIIAIGPVAQGFISIGAVSIGVIAIGAVSIGLMAIGGLALAFLALGSIALGALAIGLVAVGVFTLGGLTLGLYSIGRESFQFIENWKIILFIIMFMVIPGLIIEVWFALKRNKDK